MKLKVDGVNKAGTGFIVGKTWYNQADRNAAPQFVGLRGAEIEVELNGETTFVKSFKVLTAAAPAGEAKSSSVGSAKSAYKTDPEDALRMSRAAALEAVYGSPSLAVYVQNKDESQAYSILEGETIRATNYILNGKFSDNPEAQGEKK